MSGTAETVSWDNFRQAFLTKSGLAVTTSDSQGVVIANSSASTNDWGKLSDLEKKKQIERALSLFDGSLSDSYVVDPSRAVEPPKIRKTVEILEIGGRTLFAGGGFTVRREIETDRIMNATNGNAVLGETMSDMRVLATRELCVACDGCQNKKSDFTFARDYQTNLVKCTLELHCNGNCPEQIVEEQKKLAKKITNISQSLFLGGQADWIKRVTHKVSKEKAQPEQTVVSPLPFESNPESELEALENELFSGNMPIF